MAIVEVQAGVCGFSTEISAQADDMYQVEITITSQCGQIQALAALLTELSALEELRLPIDQATPYKLAAACGVHAACPVPGAVIKAMEVAAGLALPADVSLRIRKE